jgi:hypothetical protein
MFPGLSKDCIPSGAKAIVDFGALAARLKPGPDTKQSSECHDSLFPIPIPYSLFPIPYSLFPRARLYGICPMGSSITGFCLPSFTAMAHMP